MSKDIILKTKEYLKAGLSIIPTGDNKQPLLNTWDTFKEKPLTEPELETLFRGEKIRLEIEIERKNKQGETYIDKGVKMYKAPSGIGIVCGKVSGGLEVIDVDTKHDTTGSLWEELRTLIEDNLPDLYNKLVIAQTKSGGYHIYYRCSLIDGNLKLSTKKNKEVLVETRGEGGYVVAPPTSGYTYIQGEPINIPTITTEEREILFSISKSFNEKSEKEETNKKEANKNIKDKYPGVTSLEDYDNRGDLLELLRGEGWREVETKGDRVYLLRPGSTDSKSSGNYHTIKRSFICFSTSTPFTAGEPYSPSEAYNLLKCGGDWTKTALELGKAGYGDYKPNYKQGTQLKTERIKVEVVNSVNRETSVISKQGDALNIETIKKAIGEEVRITATGEEAKEEIVKAIDLILQTGKRIYVKEGEEEIREYKYKLEIIFNKYGSIQEREGGLTDRETDNFLDEIVILAKQLQPIDRERFIKEFIDLEPIKELGVGKESLEETVNRLKVKEDKEAQDRDFKKLLSKATELQSKGATEEALDFIENKVKEVKLKDKATEFSKLLIPTSEAQLKERQAKKPESLSSGYTIGGEPLLLPSGAVSIFTAPTSHGKTTFLINLALNVATASPDKETYLFSYEEDGDSILINTLNTYLDEEISSNNRRTLQSYFTTGSTEYIKSQSKDYFTSTKDKFFRELIETKRLNIHYSSYNSDTLIEAIRYLHKHAKPGAIFIDYIQLLNLPEGKYKTYSRQEEIKEICIALKDVAVETGLPIILGAQFNREVVNQLRIHATKIGEAGDIERIANLIVGFWNNNFKPLASEGETNEINARNLYAPNTLYTTILKNRGGRVGLEEILSFNGNTGKVKNRVEETKDLF